MVQESSVAAMQPIVIGLTGGIASGKSSARYIFGELGCVTLDADRLGHACYEPGSPCLKELVSLFGADILRQDGSVDRPALGSIVFADKAKLEMLNKTVWPHIRARIAAELTRHRAGPVGSVIVVEAALLLEAGWDDLVDEIWVSYVSPDVARQRLMIRNQLSEEEAQKRIVAQLSNEQRLAKATVQLCNDGSPEEYRTSVQKQWQLFLERHKKTSNLPGRRCRL